MTGASGFGTLVVGRSMENSKVVELKLDDRRVGPAHPTYVIAELSGNHGGRIDRAKDLIRVAASVGADAVKLQTYTADTLTIDSDKAPFIVGEGTPWSGRRLHNLYREAATPWEWTPELQNAALDAGVHLFSSPFDRSAVDFLDDLDVPAFKIASFELVDPGLIGDAAAKERPLILSTGMATAREIGVAVNTARRSGSGGVALLRCNSAYPAPPAEMDLRTIPDMAERWEVPIGLSDHTLGTVAAVTAVALGACIVEKHLTMSRAEPGPDASFSLEPDDFAELVRDIRDAERALGRVRYGPSESEGASLAFRRSLFVVQDVDAGEEFTDDNVRSIRPANGLPPGVLDRVLGRHAATHVERGTPLTWDLIDD
jgi:N-acetylneuraminate synthase